MAMTRFEKLFVNRERKGKRNIDKVRPRLEQLDIENLHDVLELGCGIGSVSAYLSEIYQMNVVGTDFDPAQVDIARSNYPENYRLQFRVEDASNLSFEDGSFDLVLSQNVFHHIPAWDVAVYEVSRVLRQGGYFIWLDLVFPRFVVTLFQPLVKNYGMYTDDEIEKVFVKNGFSLQYAEKLAHGPFTHHHVVLQKSEI
jgi:ubiquinone/menaquinone biosynthesis C-methylase UbiE